MVQLGKPAVGRIGAVGLLAWLGFGCGGGSPEPQAPSQPYRGIKVVVGTVGDPAVLPTVTAQRGEWSATRGAELEVRDTPVRPEAPDGVDVIVFRGDRLGDLVDAGALVAVPEALVRPPRPAGQEAASPGEPAEPPADPLQFADVLPALRDQVAKYGSQRMGLPYGASALVLVYQRPALENPANQAAAREAKRALEPPATWEQLDALAGFLHNRDWNNDGTPETGLAVALGIDPEGVANAIYLARAASLGQHRDQYSFLFDADTMEPRIDTPPFVEALEGLVKLKAVGPSGAEGMDAAEARRAFAEGRVALLIDRAECVASWGPSKSIGVASLPGSARVFDPSNRVWQTSEPPNRPSYLPYGGGWLVGVSSKTQGLRREAALDLARYLVAPEAASRVRADRAFPMLAVRSLLLGQGPPDPSAAPGVDARQWSSAVTQTLAAERVVPGLRIPGAEGYLADLAEGRRAAMRGKAPAEALQDVARAWRKRTETLGARRQLWHYRRSLNSLITTPEPPER